MDFVSRITRAPRAYEKDRGVEIGQIFGDQPTALKEVLIGAGGSSPFLYSVMEKQANWLRQALSTAPEDAFAGILLEIDGLADRDLGQGLRRAKSRLSVLAALSDLAGVWSLEQVTAALTDFADRAVARGVTSLVAAEIDRGKLPGAYEEDKACAGGMAVLAMGKMGAHELNYSSDIDLICLFDESRFDADDYSDARASLIRVTRQLTRLLSDLTADGYVFRTDLRLRPDPSVTPVCLSMEAAAQYYESVGRTWERAAHIKARVCAGDFAAGQNYLKNLRPFVWRRHLDFAAIQDAHDMRLRIRSHKGLHGPIILEGHNMKLGAGGIREIEFFTQTRQIIAGGRDESLREPATKMALDRLAAKDWLPADTTEQLKADYTAHREIEHRLQMINDTQTHELPKTKEGFERLAALAGRDVAELRDDLATRLTRVQAMTEGFFAATKSAETPTQLSVVMSEVVSRWRTYPSLRSSRAAEIFERLKPEILTKLQDASAPDEALLQFDDFLSGLPAGVQIFSLFEANPQLIDLIVDIASTAPRLAHYLGHNAQVFDAVIGGDFFAAWPGKDALLAEFKQAVDRVPDYEGKLDAVRQTMKEWHFRTGVHHLRGLISAQQSGTEYAVLAKCVLGVTWPLVVAEFSAKHGPEPGRGATILGMGSLGSGRLTAVSDLDLIVIYDAGDVENSEGGRPLPTRTYYARLTQALVTGLSAAMSEGRLYEVDMRLRPSGRKGPVATSLNAFRSYQLTEAWTWEHLALTRARPIAGHQGLGQEIDAFRAEILQAKKNKNQILNDVIDMRARISEAKVDFGDWDAKLGNGRLQDIELIAQTAAMLAGSPARTAPEQLAAGIEIGWISAADSEHLLGAHDLMWRLQAAGKLLGDESVDIASLGQGGLNYLLRETETRDASDLAAKISMVTAKASQVIDKLLNEAE